MLILKSIVAFLVSLGSFVFEIKTILYCIDSSKWWLLIASVLGFGFVGYFLEKVNNKIEGKMMKKSERFFVSFFLFIAISVVFVMQIPIRSFFDRFEYLKIMKEIDVEKDKGFYRLNRLALRRMASFYLFVLVLFCIEIWIWISLIGIGWGNVILEILGSAIIGYYVFATKENIFGKLGGLLLILPFFCSDLLGLILTIIAFMA